MAFVEGISVWSKSESLNGIRLEKFTFDPYVFYFVM